MKRVVQFIRGADFESRSRSGLDVKRVAQFH